MCETMMLGFFGSNDRPVVHMFDPKKSWQVAVPWFSAALITWYILILEKKYLHGFEKPVFLETD